MPRTWPVFGACLLDPAVPAVRAQQARAARPPQLNIVGLRNGGVDWVALTYMRSKRQGNGLRGKLRSRIANNLQMAGIPVLHEGAVLSPVDPADQQRPLWQCLGHVPPFNAFHESERRDISEIVDTQLFEAGTSIICAGDQGNSQVLVPADGGEEVVVGNITAGNIFGEMSLLTGAPHSATVRALTGCLVHELRSDDLAPFLKARPALLEKLTQIVVQRQAATRSHLASTAAGDQTPTVEKASLLAKVCLFLKL